MWWYYFKQTHAFHVSFSTLFFCRAFTTIWLTIYSSCFMFIICPLLCEWKQPEAKQIVLFFPYLNCNKTFALKKYVLNVLIAKWYQRLDLGSVTSALAFAWKIILSQADTERSDQILVEEMGGSWEESDPGNGKQCRRRWAEKLNASPVHGIMGQEI